MSRRDTIYASKQPVEPFSFDSKVAEAFDDMANRSIPFYLQVQELCAGSAADLFRTQQTSSPLILDLGCSTGNTLLHIDRVLQNEQARFHGIDSSEPMVAKCQKKVDSYVTYGRFAIQAGNLMEASLPQAHFLCLNYVLQFIQPAHKAALLSKLFAQTVAGGALFVSEKVSSSAGLQDFFTTTYHSFKQKNGYSQLEISQKREALEKVLTPVTLEELIEMLHDAGYRTEILFKWVNFVSLLALKD